MHGAVVASMLFIMHRGKSVSCVLGTRPEFRSMTARWRTCWLLLLLRVCPRSVLAYPCEVGCPSKATAGSLAASLARQKSHQLAPTAMTLNNDLCVLASLVRVVRVREYSDV